MPKIIHRDSALTTIARRKQDRDRALLFLEENEITFEHWATDPDRKEGDRFKGVIQLREDSTGHDIIEKAFKDSGWTCSTVPTGTPANTVGMLMYEVLVTF